MASQASLPITPAPGTTKSRSGSSKRAANGDIRKPKQTWQNSEECVLMEVCQFLFLVGSIVVGCPGASLPFNIVALASIQYRSHSHHKQMLTNGQTHCLVWQAAGVEYAYLFCHLQPAMRQQRDGWLLQEIKKYLEESARKKAAGGGQMVAGQQRWQPVANAINAKHHDKEPQSYTKKDWSAVKVKYNNMMKTMKEVWSNLQARKSDFVSCLP
jgi:hypothetical protein